MVVKLFPNWVVKLVRNPNLRTRFWLDRPVEVFHVSPEMTKFEIKEYLIQLYNLPVSHVHTAIFTGKVKTNLQTGRKYKTPDYKKAYVYLQDAAGENKIRYHHIEYQKTPEAIDAFPARAHRALPKTMPEYGTPERDALAAQPKDRNAARQKPLHFRPHDVRFPVDLFPKK